MAKIDSVLSKAKPTGEIKRLTKIIEQQQTTIDDMRAAKFKMKLGRRKKPGKKTFVFFRRPLLNFNLNLAFRMSEIWFCCFSIIPVSRLISPVGLALLKTESILAIVLCIPLEVYECDGELFLH